MSETARNADAGRSIEDVQRSEERLARIVGLSADAIICIDEEQTITLFNEGAERTFLCKATDIIGRKLTQLIPQRYRQAHGGHVAGFAGGAPGSRHMADRQAVFGLRANGEEFPADASISKIVVGGEAVYTVVLRDVTDRFQREQERRIESDRLKQAMDAGRIGGFELDQQHDRVRLFGHARSILGISDGEISTERWFSLIHPEDGPRMADAIRHAARAGHQVEMECRIRRGDGARRWVRAIAARTGGDEPWPRLFGAIQDVTEQKALQQLLEERVAERTQALEAEIVRRELAQDTLVRVQRMEAYGQLTGGIAHDFNNLLTVIGGNLALLEDQIAEPRHARILKRATDAVDMGSRLTRRLLSFASRSRLEPQVLNLNDQVVGVIDLLRRTIGEGIAISSELAPDLGRVRADASEIENAILNLAINARDAMSGGGQLVIETANVALEAGEARPAGIEHLAAGRYVRLSVSDTGVGMAPEVLARAFEPFFTTKEPGQGTGLGLASIYGFARQSQGGVTLESEPGKGTMVSIYLPDLGMAGASGAAPASAAKAASSSSTILVVEDNPDVREVTIERLEQLGYAVLSSASGPDAVALLSRDVKVDLVFSDVMMAGGMSGHDVASWIAANRPGLRVLLTSGFAGPAAARPGGPRILSKPYSTTELAEAIAGALDL
jgi:PAS domain S-box-containing protein